MDTKIWLFFWRLVFAKKRKSPITLSFKAKNCPKLDLKYRILYFQVPNKCPPSLLIFRFYSNPPDLIRPPFISFKENDFFMNPSFHFLSLLVLFTPNIQGKIECFGIYCSSVLNVNLFLFLPSFYNNLKPFLKFRLPVYFDPPVY